MGETVSLIFHQLDTILQYLQHLEGSRSPSKRRGNNYNSNSAPLSFNPTTRRVSTSSLKSSQPKQGVSLCFQRTQVLLYVAKIACNEGKWSNRREILVSLSKLLSMRPGYIDLVEWERLPNSAKHIRLLLKFKSSFIPSMLFQSKEFLVHFKISPVRVFLDLNITSLWMHSNLPQATLPLQLCHLSLFCQRIDCWITVLIGSKIL